jgi:hypothetical protein
MQEIASAVTSALLAPPYTVRTDALYFLLGKSANLKAETLNLAFLCKGAQGSVVG